MADYANNRVLHFPSGVTTADLVYAYGQLSFTASAGGVSATQLQNPRAVEVDRSGAFYVTDGNNPRWNDLRCGPVHGAWPFPT